VLFAPGLDSSICLANIRLTAFTWDAVYAGYF
jgi:hypothetical protein